MVWSQTIPLASYLTVLHFVLWVPVIPKYIFLFFKLLFAEPVPHHESNTALRIFTWVMSFNPDDNSRR